MQFFSPAATNNKAGEAGPNCRKPSRHELERRRVRLIIISAFFVEPRLIACFFFIMGTIQMLFDFEGSFEEMPCLLRFILFKKQQSLIPKTSSKPSTIGKLLTDCFLLFKESQSLL